MITIPTTELIGGLSDVLPIISDDKASLAGVKLHWDGEALHFTTYDVFAGATVQWVPGEGAEGDVEDDDVAVTDDIEWGGDDAPWSVWLWLPQAKEILKVFRLPAKLWRFPVAIKVSPMGHGLTVERQDGPRAGRMLRLNTDNDQLKHIPDVAEFAAIKRTPTDQPRVFFAPSRMAALGAVRPHGSLAMAFGADDEPVAVHVGGRYVGFLYPARAQGVRAYSFLRDGSGVHASGATDVG